MKKTFKVNALSELGKVAEALLASTQGRTVYAFYGSMGAGKTTFIKALCAYMGVQGVVNSPTFAIVNEYENPEGEPVFHFDFYRINSAQEALDIGYQEYIDSGYLCLIEWPEKIENLLPENCVYISIVSEDSTGIRTISWES